MINPKRIKFMKRIEEIGSLPWKLYERKRYHDASLLFGELAMLYKYIGDLEKACESFYFASKCALLSEEYEFAEREYSRAIDVGLQVNNKYVEKALNELRNLYDLTGKTDLLKEVEKVAILLEAEKAIKKCPNCGAEMSSDANYCGLCGCKLL